MVVERTTADQPWGRESLPPAPKCQPSLRSITDHDTPNTTEPTKPKKRMVYSRIKPDGIKKA